MQANDAVSHFRAHVAIAHAGAAKVGDGLGKLGLGCGGWRNLLRRLRLGRQ